MSGSDSHEPALDVERWDASYGQQRKYEGDPPIAFVKKIYTELGPERDRLIGLYPGCGNGRNFVPLMDFGLNLYGTDISAEALKQLLVRRPDAANKISRYDFANNRATRVFDYIVSIQVFQHGDQQRTREYFANSAQALKPGGKLFLRINSASTQIKHAHHRIEENPQGGFTIIYDEGDKEGMKIHFYTAEELAEIAATYGFTMLEPPSEAFELRDDNESIWSQWETIWQKA
jgi:SAM-dependent methyltransferase